MKIAPGNFLAINIIVMIIPNTANSTSGLCIVPSVTKVESSFLTIPAPCKPTKVINNPIPADTAIFNSNGIALIITSRKPLIVNIANITPENNTPVKPVCHGIPIVSTTVNAKNAFNPIPGAKAIGYFAMIPINKQPTSAAKAVATNTEPWSILIESGTFSTLAKLNIDGLTANMYAIDKNVVKPPRISLYNLFPIHQT